MTKSSIALMLIAAGTLSACGGRPVVKEKETVIEKPVVVQPAPAAAGGTTANASCTYQAQNYTHGARSCQQSAEWVCTNGAWQRTNNSC